jgi:hypothetical protein
VKLVVSIKEPECLGKVTTLVSQVQRAPLLGSQSRREF